MVCLWILKELIIERKFHGSWNVFLQQLCSVCLHKIQLISSNWFFCDKKITYIFFFFGFENPLALSFNRQ